MDRSGCRVHLFKLFGRDVAKRRMEPLAVVEAFQIGKNDASGLGPRFEVIAVQAFGFEFTPVTLHCRMTEAVIGTRETDFNPKASKNGLILGTGVLSTSVRMVQQPSFGLTGQQCHA